MSDLDSRLRDLFPIYDFCYNFMDDTYTIRYPPSVSTVVNATICYKILAAATSDDDAKEKLMDYFWGYALIQDKPRSNPPSPEACSHEWVEVILFAYTQERCRFCDIKKS